MYNIFKRNTFKVLELIFPIECVICKTEHVYICDKCISKLELFNKEKNGQINDWTYVKYKYKNEYLRKIEYKIKYHHHPKLAEKIGFECADFIIKKIVSKNNLKKEQTFLLPIPLSKQRLKERGYNQSFHIAKGISQNSNLQLLDILNRHNNTNKLKDIHGIDTRIQEIKNSMSTDKIKFQKLILKIKESDTKLEDIKIILIDDITTTGTTFYEARRCLIENSFRKENIYAFSLGH